MFGSRGREIPLEGVDRLSGMACLTTQRDCSGADLPTPRGGGVQRGVLRREGTRGFVRSSSSLKFPTLLHRALCCPGRDVSRILVFLFEAGSWVNSRTELQMEFFFLETSG